MLDDILVALETAPLNCEVEFLPVGTGAKAGDAIVVRYGNDTSYKLMLVDGGHAETGAKIVDHLRTYFGPYPVLEHVVLTHSDGDHASGIRKVLEDVPVRHLWMHIPWLLAENSRDLFADKRWTSAGLERAVRAEYGIISEIFDLALEKGCQIHLPFEGQDIGPFRVMSPTALAYRFLLPQFEKTPEPDVMAIKDAHWWLGKESSLRKFLEAAKAAVHGWIAESWYDERLRDGGVTSASNETSAVLYGTFGSKRVLLTGDAGLKALTWSADYADRTGLPLQQFTFVQIPHHGSRRNVGPTILNRLLGPIVPEGTPARFSAFVSAPPDDASHPRRIVLNAFKRRGGSIVATQGRSKIHYGGFARRSGYGSADELPFYTVVEEYT
ncbi:ComEC/Rec2 family competence protein [Sphingopyxis sp. Q841]|uniref:ComEC/Rec2 family competence protein n=1 Tax=Sphingopyxis sp. Q841 TaxID=3458250 RepID=UPI004036BE4D